MRAARPATALVVALLTVSWLLFELYHSNEQAVAEELQAYQRPAAVQVARQVGGHLEVAAAALRALAASQAHPPDGSGRSLWPATSLRQDDLHLRGVALYDARGRHEEAHDAMPDTMPPALRAALGAVPAGEVVVAWTSSSPSRDLLMATPLAPSNGSPTGGGPRALAFRIDVASILREQADQAGLANDRSVWALDDEGRLIFHSSHPEMTGRRASPAMVRTCGPCHRDFQHTSRMLAGGEGTVTYQLQDHPRKLAAYAPVRWADLRWTVAVDLAYDRVTAVAKHNLRLASAILVVVSAALLLAGAVVHRQEKQKVMAEEEARHWRERRALEEEVRHSRNYFEALIQNPLDAIFTVRRDGTLGFVNRRLAAMTGDAAADARGRRFEEILAPELRADALRNWREIGAHGSGAYETQIVRVDGTRLDCLLSQSSVEGFDETLVVLKDISERKAMDRALREVAGEWQRTCDALEAAILVLDLHGRILRLNRAARDASGRDYQDCLGRLLPELQPWPPAGRASSLVEAAARGGVGGPLEVHDERGGRFWELTATRAEWGDAARVLLVARDVTHTVELRESVRRSEKMAAIGALTAGVAHEVRNPLFALSANVDALEALLGEDGDLREILDALRREVNRLTCLMEDLLDYGRPVAAALEPVPFADVVEEARRLCEPIARQSRVALCDGHAPDGALVAMDHPRLAQVLENLLENAIQHSPPSGIVDISVETFSRDGAPWLAWTVADRGPGFRDDDLPRLFEPFFTRRRGGTGLGLSIAQRIAEHHGGRVLAANRLGGGALMRLELPCA